jgi:hypothetical protein
VATALGAKDYRWESGRGKKNDKTPAPPKSEPDGEAQRNFTDPDSRILKTVDGYIRGYNAQDRCRRDSRDRGRARARLKPCVTS